jgi:hypothetical protein
MKDPQLGFIVALVLAVYLFFPFPQTIGPEWVVTTLDAAALNSCFEALTSAAEAAELKAALRHGLSRAFLKSDKRRDPSTALAERAT